MPKVKIAMRGILTIFPRCVAGDVSTVGELIGRKGLPAVCAQAIRRSTSTGYFRVVLIITRANAAPSVRFFAFLPEGVLMCERRSKSAVTRRFKSAAL